MARIRRLFSRGVGVALACSLAAGLWAPDAAFAQSDQVSAPPVLQFPFAASPDAPRSILLLLVRGFIEQGGNAALCSSLLTAQKKAVPPRFKFEDCPSDLRSKVLSGKGVVHWVKGERPSECGADCFGRPFTFEPQDPVRPNLRQVRVFGTLKFVVDSVFDRALTYGYTVIVTCDAANGKQDGVVKVSVAVDPPVVGGPGLLETVADGLSLGHVSQFIDQQIGSPRQPSGLQTQILGRCASIGMSRGDTLTTDTATYDLPAPGSRPRPTAMPAVLGPSARIEFFGIRRNSEGVPTSSDDPGLAPQFFVFLNGQQVALPPVRLAPGGDQPLNLCRTIDMKGWDRLQLLFVDYRGGAVWSQFTKREDFGSGLLRRMTTARTMLLPGDHGPGPQPALGGNHPQPALVREFELRYRVTALGVPGVHVRTGGSASGAVSSTGEPLRAPCRGI